MQEFLLILKNTKLRAYNRFAWISIIFISIVQIGLTFTDSYKKDTPTALTFVGLIVFLLIVGRGYKYNATDKREYIGIAYTLLCALWIKWHLYWIAGIVLLFVVLYFISTRKFQLIVSKKNIQMPSFPSKKINWNDLNNIIIKDDLLTLDFKSDKLMQVETEGDDFFNEKEFNEFCRQQLRTAGTSI